MSLHGWKQLAEWSLDHSCLSAAEIERARAIHARDWEEFCVWVCDVFGSELELEEGGDVVMR